MGQFGQARLRGLSDTPEAGIKAWHAQVTEGTRRDGPLARLRYLARANYAYNYIFWLRTRSNDPAWVGKGARIEQRLKMPFARRGQTERAAAFDANDFHFESQAIPAAALRAFAEELDNQPSYHDPYASDFRHEGSPRHGAHPFLYMDPQRIVDSAAFWDICTAPALAEFCREVLGPSAAISWAWAWISQPGAAPYQNQNWHRDCAEPFNFIRVFIPLGAIESRDDGPTEVIPGTSGLRDFYEVRRFGDDELAGLKLEKGAGVVLSEPGDVYFVNTFALHRGTPPQRPRAMLTLLVSLSPSHRTPSIRRVKRASLSAPVRSAIAANKRFFRYLV
ncbi:hypothetical protein QH494_13220 [Sphingomonas sp. AR_OL41]|uniref:hypothetical protein n=1 Tax=Sphingomonas sp. AR_OL41 TaxID=3042729 RepID=UPI00247FBB25|nr:hypothetical protein [Sphingomonas sp. AR_OL41]MDH7973143.1 hypothetical protein [Sphingomonas sp. AR_OL41]